MNRASHLLLALDAAWSKRLRIVPALSVAMLLAACQSLPPAPAAIPTPLEQRLAARPLPANGAVRDAECLSLAELYTASLVAQATWEYARTPHKPSREALDGAMRAAQARAERLACPAFWEIEE